MNKSHLFCRIGVFIGLKNYLIINLKIKWLRNFFIISQQLMNAVPK